MNAQSQWHGNIESSTDTLVPIETFSSNLAEDQIRSELSTAVTKDNSMPNENGDRLSISPDMHISSTLANENATIAMDESIFIQPEQQQMEISNGNRMDFNQSVTNVDATMPLFRRRHNSFNSKPSSCTSDMTVTSQTGRSDSISPNTMNSKFALPSTSRSLATTKPFRTINMPSQTTTTTTNISMISCPDGLAHALNEQNLRLQQIVHEHKVSLEL